MSDKTTSLDGLWVRIGVCSLYTDSNPYYGFGIRKEIPIISLSFFKNLFRRSLRLSTNIIKVLTAFDKELLVGNIINAVRWCILYETG